MRNIFTLAAITAIVFIYGACAKADDDPVPVPPVPPPVTTATLVFSPQTATADDSVLVKGIGFTGATAITFGGANAKSFTILSDTIILAVVNANTPSGSVTVTKASGSATGSGFTYYTPASCYLTGTAKYTTWNAPVPNGSPVRDTSLYREYTVNDTASFLVRKINPNNTQRNQSAVGANLKPPRRSIFADSSNYVILTGVSIQNTSSITNYNGYVYKFSASGLPAYSSVFARVTDTILTIPSQTPLDGYIIISGTGVIKNGVVVSLDYFVDEYFGNTKRASLRKP